MRQSGLVIAFVLLLVVPVSCFVLWFDVAALYDVVRQFRSADYASVNGTITESRVNTFQGSKGGPRSYFGVRYTYEVGGRQFEGTRVRYVSVNSSDRYSPWLLAKQYRPKTPVPVFYRPEDPADSLLLPGWSGGDVLYPMYPGLFTALALSLWCIAAVLGRDPTRITERELQGRMHLTLHVMPPSLIGVFWAGIVTLVGTGWSFSSSDPSIATALCAWAAVFIVGGAAALVRWARLRSGTFDVIFDEKTLSLPATHGRKRRIEVPVDHVVTVSLERRGQQKKSYRPQLEIVDPRRGSRVEPLGPWLTYQDRAQAVADGLKVQLRITERRAKAGTPASSEAMEQRQQDGRHNRGY